MEYTEMNRLSRLTAILLKLQTKRILTAAELANKFGVSKRTIYRDMRALEDAGVPVLTKEGIGYNLMEGFNVPPVMFTEKQAYALIIAEQLVLNSSDTSLIQDYSEAMDKIKSILKHSLKDKANLLTDRTQCEQVLNQKRNSNNLSDLQDALTNYKLVEIEYTNNDEIQTIRKIEPFSLLNAENWYMIAYCRLRKEFRFFRLDRIKKMRVFNENFAPHNLTLQEYFDQNRT